MPHDLIFLTIGGVQSQFQREDEYFAFLGTLEPHTTQWSPRGIFPIFLLTSLEMSQKYKARLFTIGKAGMGYILTIIT